MARCQNQARHHFVGQIAGRMPPFFFYTVDNILEFTLIEFSLQTIVYCILLVLNYSSVQLRNVNSNTLAMTKQPCNLSHKEFSTAACSKILGREFDHEKDFLHAQGEILNDSARCHVLIDCNYHDVPPKLEDIELHCYRVKKAETSW